MRMQMVQRARVAVATLLVSGLIGPSLVAQGRQEAPHLPDGTPNLGSTAPGNGVWVRKPSPRAPRVSNMGAHPYLVEPNDGIPYQRWAKARAAYNQSVVDKYDPAGNCLPPGVPRMMSLPTSFEIIQESEPKRIVMLFEGATYLWRQVFMDGRPHPQGDALTPTWLGHSVGHWDKDTLVIDTVGFNEGTWLDAYGNPHTDLLHVVEKIARPDLMTLRYEVTIDDPGAYTKPWISRWNIEWDPNGQLHEYICQGEALAKQMAASAADAENSQAPGDPPPLRTTPPANTAGVRRRIPKEAAEPTPRLTDGKPNLGGKGFWNLTRTFNMAEPAALLDPKEGNFHQPWAKAKAEFNWRNDQKYDPEGYCLPPGGPRMMSLPYPMQFIMQPELKRVVMLEEGGSHVFRIIHMDGRQHPADLTPTFLGHAIGRWEGDTLIVDSVGYNEQTWLDPWGNPHTDKLHVIERFSRPNLATLHYEATIDDPGAYTRTWTTGWDILWTPNGELMEYICQENNRYTYGFTGDNGKRPSKQ